jgi:hypothetical protein
MVKRPATTGQGAGNLQTNQGLVGRMDASTGRARGGGLKARKENSVGHEARSIRRC